MLGLAKGLLVVGVRARRTTTGQLTRSSGRRRVRRVQVQPIEERLAVAVAVEGLKFRGIGKRSPHRAHRREVADRWDPASEIQVRRQGVERAVAARHVPDGRL